MNTLKGKITLGEGLGGTVEQLKAQNEMKLNDDCWLNYQKAKGEESFHAFMAGFTDLQDYIVPYSQSFCSLEERVPETALK